MQEASVAIGPEKNMAGYNCLPMKMKRKEIDRVNNDFSDFSLSSPARKIRRLVLFVFPSSNFDFETLVFDYVDDELNCISGFGFATDYGGR